MAHIPINHPLRPLYRVLTALAGLYVLIFGIIGATKSSGASLFDQDHLHWVLGLRTNLAFAILSIIAGIVILVAVFIGRNIDHYLDIGAGLAFMVVGMLMLGLLRTDANFLGFSVVNCVVSFIIGVVVFAAGLYGKTGSDQDVASEESFRHHHH
ncbi:hypothetical protein GCM10023322_54390 [Rugosimonospora acidiphila]|uniref:DUF4383 domain-containing protein n=1 Tax=Rugosimonospora acidiphila TaxID=556531 RepID=A0ABP9SC52_9ACTN